MAEQYLDALLNEQPALAATLARLRDCHGKRHWHQLTEALLGAAFGQADEAGLAGVDLRAFYHGFVKPWEAKMRPTALVRFVAAAANRGGAAGEVDAGHALLDALVDSDAKKKRMGAGACAYPHARALVAVRARQWRHPGRGELGLVSLSLSVSVSLSVSLAFFVLSPSAPFAGFFWFICF